MLAASSSCSALCSCLFWLPACWRVLGCWRRGSVGVGFRSAVAPCALPPGVRRLGRVRAISVARALVRWPWLAGCGVRVGVCVRACEACVLIRRAVAIFGGACAATTPIATDHAPHLPVSRPPHKLGAEVVVHAVPHNDRGRQIPETRRRTSGLPEHNRLPNTLPLLATSGPMLTKFGQQ